MKPGEKQSIAFWLFAAVIGGFVLFTMWPFMAAIFGAAILSVLTMPMYRRFRARFSETVAAALALLSSVLVIVLPMGIVAFLVVVQINLAVKGQTDAGQVFSLDQAIAQADAAIGPTLRGMKIDFTLQHFYDENQAELTQKVGTAATGALRQTAINGLLTLVALLTAFFMVRDGHTLRRGALAAIPMPKANAEHLLDRVYQSIHAVFIGVVMVAVIQGTVSSVAFAAVGVPNWLIWGAAVTVFSCIPFLGPPVVFVPLIGLMLSQGKTWQAIVLAVIGFGIVTQIDNLIRPKVIGDRIGLNYITIFFALIAGIIAFGPIGLFAGPVLAVLAMDVFNYILQSREAADSLGEPKPDHASDAI